MTELQTTIPKGSWVLVTGLTGFIATFVAKQFFELGYKVRGTVRDLEKASWLRDDLFKSQAEKGNLELVVVPDLGVENGFDDAVKGMSAIIHLATVVDMGSDPSVSVTKVLTGINSLLKAAMSEPSVKEFVFTSTLYASGVRMIGKNIHVERETLRDQEVDIAWSQPPLVGHNAFYGYNASKIAAEKRIWEFVAEKKPNFTVNIVTPAGVIGDHMHRPHAESPGAWLRLLYDGDVNIVYLVLTMAQFVDIKDVALLHVATVLDPDIKQTRIPAWGHNAKWNDLLAIMRKLMPDRKFMDDLVEPDFGTLTTDSSQSLALLEKWGHRNDWIPLEETVAENLRVLNARSE